MSPRALKCQACEEIHPSVQMRADDRIVDACDQRTWGPVVNGERFAPGYSPEAAAYEQRTRGAR